MDNAIAGLIADGREIGIQVAAYLDGRLVVDSWGGLADPTSDRAVDGEKNTQPISASHKLPTAATKAKNQRRVVTNLLCSLQAGLLTGVRGTTMSG